HCLTSAARSSRSFFYRSAHHRELHSFPTRRSSDLSNYILSFDHQFRARLESFARVEVFNGSDWVQVANYTGADVGYPNPAASERSEEHTSELQSRENLVCRLLLEKKKTKPTTRITL